MLSCPGARRLAAVLLLAISVYWPAPAQAGSPAGWRWPLGGVPTVLRPFQPPPTPYAAGHRGVDLGAATGAAVLAAGDGIIGYAGRLAGRGVVTVVHGALRTTYEPVAAVVHAGQPISAGGLIGRLQPPTGHCGAGRPCLHWGLLRGTIYLDPLALLDLTHPILLPMAGVHTAISGGSAGWGNRSGTRQPAAQASPAVAPGRPGPSRSPPWLPIGAAALLIGAGLVLTPGRRAVFSSRFD